MFISDLPKQNSIKFGDFWFPPSAIETIATRCVRLLTFEFDGYIGFQGSSTLFAYKGRKYAVTTRHQLSVQSGQNLSESELASVRITTMHNGMLANILTNQCIFETSNPDEEFHDLVIFQVAPDAEQTVKEHFSYAPIVKLENVEHLLSFSIGYPSTDNCVYYGNPHVRSVVAVRPCIEDRKFQTSATYLRRFIDRDVDYNLDGFSGGAVFSIIKSETGYELGLNGIIIRAGNGNIHTISSAYLATVFEA